MTQDTVIKSPDAEAPGHWGGWTNPRRPGTTPGALPTELQLPSRRLKATVELGALPTSLKNSRDTFAWRRITNGRARQIASLNHQGTRRRAEVDLRPRGTSITRKDPLPSGTRSTRVRRGTAQCISRRARTSNAADYPMSTRRKAASRRSPRPRASRGWFEAVQGRALLNGGRRGY